MPVQAMSEDFAEDSIVVLGRPVSSGCKSAFGSAPSASRPGSPPVPKLTMTHDWTGEVIPSNTTNLA